ncbi:MAG: hypothetical protein ACFFDF_03225 [Candidatus Odinarchaeota archaeon]
MMIKGKKHKNHLKRIFVLTVLLFFSLFPTYLMNISNFSNKIENLQEDLDDDKLSDYIKTPKLSSLGEDEWWNSSWQCRMLINVTNPYPYDFENYGVSVAFDYVSLGSLIQSSLDDIRIVENGTLRKYYVKKDYPSLGLATVWFDTNINDTIPGDDIETDTYMYFGNEDALNAEAINPTDSFGWIKNGDFELDIDYSQYFDPYGWTFSHNPINSIHGETNPGVTSENIYGIEFANRLVNVSAARDAERVYQGNVAYKFGADRSALSALDEDYNSYAGAFFSYPFTVPKVYGAGIELHLYRNIRTWGFITNSPIDDDGYYIRLCDNYGPDPDTHTDIGTPGTYENYIEIWGGRAFTTGPAQKINSWQHPTKVWNWDRSETKNTYSTQGIDGELTAPIDFNISEYEGDTIFLELGVWGQEVKYHSGFFQLDDLGFNYTGISTSINELQYINSTATIITRDVDGRIVPNVEVMLIDGTIPKGSPGYQIAKGFSDTKGRVTFTNLENRKYNITANYTLGSREIEVFNSYESGVGPYYFNGISYVEEIYVDLWTIDFEVTDWDKLPLNHGYLNIYKDDTEAELLSTLTLSSTGTATFRWKNTSSYYFKLYYDNDAYLNNPVLLNTSYIHRDSYIREGEKFQEQTLWVNNTNINPKIDTEYLVQERIYANASRTEFGNKKIIKANISLSNMNDQLTQVKIYYIDKYNSTGIGNENLIYSKDYGPSIINDFIELDIPLIENAKLQSEKYEVHGLFIEVSGDNFTQSCDGILNIETIETCNIFNRTYLSRLNIRVIDEYGDPKSAVVKVYNVTNGESLVNLTGTGYMYDINGLPFWYLKGHLYNITIDAYGEKEIQFNITDIDPAQWAPSGKIRWYNHTLISGTSITFTVFLTVNATEYLTSLSNSSGTEEANWGDTAIFSTIFEYTDDDGQTWYPITDPSARCTLYIRRVGTTSDQIRVFMERGTGEGNFTIGIDTSLLSAGGTSRFYNVRIEGSYPGFPAPNIMSFLLEVKSIPTNIGAYDYDTQLEKLDKLYTEYFDESVNIMVRYSINESGIPLDNAVLTYQWLGHDPVRFNIDPVHLGFFTFTLDTEDAQTTGYKVISITASYENYTTQLNFLVYLNILERETTLNSQSTNLYYINSWVYVQNQKNFIFTYRDASTTNIIGDLTTFNYVWEELYENGTKIPGSFGSGLLTQNVNQTYTLDFNTELRSVGYYFLYVTLKQDNYEQKNAFVYLEIRLRKFTATIQEPQLGTNNQIIINQGKNLDFEIHLWDDTRDEPLQNAIVEFNFRGQTYTFDPIPSIPGAYNKTVLTRDVDTFIMAQIFIGKISIDAANFTSQEVIITIKVNMDEIWPGMPTFYFIIITAAIVGVVGSIVGYRVIQQARIPKHVKKIRKVKGLIKSKKKITDSFLVPTKEQMIVKQFGDDWKGIGLSIEESLGIDLKKKSPLKDKFTKERGENE